jgi:hypothetical protein
LVFTSTLKAVSGVRKDCPKCGKEFVIQDGVAGSDVSKKPPRKAK